MDGMSKGYDGWGGGWIFALVLIFLAVLLIGFRRDRHEGGEEGGLKALLPALLLGKLGKGGCEAGYDGYPLAVQQAKDTGQIVHNTDVQEEKTRKEICDAKFNQERLAYEATKDAKNTKIQELLAENSELKTMGAIAMLKGSLEQKMDSQYGALQHHLDKVQCEMLKRPPVWPQVFAPAGCAI